jgi:hypothetical protein
MFYRETFDYAIVGIRIRTLGPGREISPAQLLANILVHFT